MDHLAGQQKNESPAAKQLLHQGKPVIFRTPLWSITLKEQVYKRNRKLMTTRFYQRLYIHEILICKTTGLAVSEWISNWFSGIEKQTKHWARDRILWRSNHISSHALSATFKIKRWTSKTKPASINFKINPTSPTQTLRIWHMALPTKVVNQIIKNIQVS